MINLSEIKNEEMIPLDEISGEKIKLDSSNAHWFIKEVDPKWGHILNFALVRFQQSNCDGSDILVECVMHGQGVLGLRECRHTYWGEGNGCGYIFYPCGSAITETFKLLSEYFDDMI